MPSICYLERTGERDWWSLYCKLPLAMFCFVELSPFKSVERKDFCTKRTTLIETLSKWQTAKQSVFLDHLRVIVEQFAISWVVYRDTWKKLKCYI